jgi:hypothetical protein
MAQKKKIPLNKGKSQKTLLLFITGVIIAGAIGFYVGKTTIPTQSQLLTRYFNAETILVEEWPTYKSPEGWEIKYHPITHTVGDIIKNSEEYFLNEDTESITFEERFEYGSHYEISVVQNASKTPLDQWVTRWKDNSRERCKCNIEPKDHQEIVKIGNHDGIKVTTDANSGTGSEIKTVYLFLAVSDSVILAGRVDNRFGVPDSSEKILNQMMGSFTMPGATLPTN